MLNLERYEKAIECYDQVIKTDPKDEDVWNNKGAAFYYMKRYKDAMDCVNTIICLNPESINARKMKEAILQKQ